MTVSILVELTKTLILDILDEAIPKSSPKTYFTVYLFLPTYLQDHIYKSDTGDAYDILKRCDKVQYGQYFNIAY